MTYCGSCLIFSKSSCSSSAVYTVDCSQIKSCKSTILFSSWDKFISNVLQSQSLKLYLQGSHILGNHHGSQTLPLLNWGYMILQITDFTHHLIQLSDISGCNLSNGVALPPLGTVDLTMPRVAPLRSPAGASWKGVCVTGPVSSQLQPEHFINTGTFCRIQARARHELGMTPPSKVPGEFIWRPAQILCSSSSTSLSLSLFRFFRLGCEIIPIHLPDMSLREGEEDQKTFKFMAPPHHPSLSH